jgi:hypothetical protein
VSKEVRAEGSIRVEGERHGIPAGVDLYFVFDGDWSNLYEDFPESEEEARHWFVLEVDKLLKQAHNEAREDEQTAGPSDTSDRGAQ